MLFRSGAYAVSVTVTDDVSSATTGLAVAVACPVNISSLKLQAKFSRVGADTCAIEGTLPNLAADASVANAVATLDVGDAAIAFQLNAKGQGRNAGGSLKVSFNAKSGSWTFAGKLKGDLQGSWAKFGLTSVPVTNSPVTVPVVLLLQSDTVEASEIAPVLSYTDKTGVSGTATLAP